jgi:WD40 repeat protein
MRGADQKIFPELFLVAVKREHYEQRLFTDFSPLLIMAQTQPNLTELAKQGNAKAIASVMNYLLKDKGMTAKTGLKNGCLLVFLEADQVPDQQPSVEFIHKTVVKLGVASIHSLKVYGRRKAEDFPAWTREFELVAQVQPSLSTGEVTVGTPKPTAQIKSEPKAQKLEKTPKSPAAVPVPSKPECCPPEKWIWTDGHTLTGHSGWFFGGVRSVAVSPKGQTLASGGDDNTIKLWNLNTGQEALTLSGHSAAVRAVTFSPDGQTLASGSDDKTIKLWDLRTGQAIFTLSGHSQAVTAVAISPDGQTLASGSDDQTIKMWDLEAGTRLNLKTAGEICTLVGHSNYIQSVAFSPDGLTLATGSCDNTIKLWNLKTAQETLTLSGHSGDVRAVTFSPDGSVLASASDDQTIKLWNLRTKQLPCTLSGHSSKVYSIAISPDGLALASASDDQTIKLWDLKTEKVVRTFSGHSSGVSSVAFSADGQIIASGSWDKTIKIWHCEKPKLLKRISSEVGHRLSKPLNITGIFLLAIAVFWLISHIGFSGGVLLVLSKLATAILGIIPGIAGIMILILLVIFLLSGLGRVGTKVTRDDTRVNRIQEKPLTYSTINKKNNVDWWKVLSEISKNSSSDKVYVKPHRRKDGTYVKGYWRRK